jgi:hypothetical protein
MLSVYHHSGKRPAFPNPTLIDLNRILQSLMGDNGAPGKIRTPDPQIRSLVLYPAELPAQKPKIRNNLSGIGLTRPAEVCGGSRSAYLIPRKIKGKTGTRGESTPFSSILRRQIIRETKYDEILE